MLISGNLQLFYFEVMCHHSQENHQNKLSPLHHFCRTEEDVTSFHGTVRPPIFSEHVSWSESRNLSRRNGEKKQSQGASYSAKITVSGLKLSLLKGTQPQSSRWFISWETSEPTVNKKIGRGSEIYQNFVIRCDWTEGNIAFKTLKLTV